MKDFPNPPKPPMVTCPNCSSKNEPDRSSCRNCQKPMSALALWWNCGGCSAANDPDFHPRSCRSCGWGRPSSAQVEADAARAADIAAVVAGAPPLAADQLVTLRRIFADGTGQLAA